jgi:glycosyltransferase involved in cell wall biosynthesis
LYVGTLPPHQGGSALMASQLIVGLAALGHEVEAIAPITEADLGAGDRFSDRNPALWITRFTMPYLDNSPDTAPAPQYRVRESRQIQQLVSRATERRRPDVLVVGRESFAPHLAGLVDVPGILLAQGATSNGVAEGRYPRRLAERLLRDVATFDLAVVSAPHMERMLRALGLARLELIPNPVDLDRFRPGPASAAVRRELGVSEGDVVIMHISNLKPLKRPLDLVDAAAIAAREDERLVFVVVGDGLLRAAVEEAAAARGLTGRFRFTGWVDFDRVPDFIRTSDLVVMPSQAEAQALVYLETQASGRVLLASDIPAARDVLEDGVNGLLFPLGDAETLARTILRCASEPGLRAAIGLRARRGVREHSLRRVVDSYSELLESLVAEAPLRRAVSSA